MNAPCTPIAKRRVKEIRYYQRGVILMIIALSMLWAAWRLNN